MSHIKKVAGIGESSAALEQELREIDQSLGLAGREHRIPEDVFLTQDYFQRQVAYAQERISQRKLTLGEWGSQYGWRETAQFLMMCRRN